MNNLLLDTILFSPNIGKIKKTPSGWFSFNCPACIYNGEPSPDKKSRGGIYVTPSNEIIYNCFRCNFSTYWKPGLVLSRKMKLLLSYLHVDPDKISNLSFQIWKEYNSKILNEENKNNEFSKSDFLENTCFDNEITENSKFLKEFFSEFKEESLPYKSRTLKDCVNLFKNDKNFIDVLNFLYKKRGEDIFSQYDFCWSPHPKFCRKIIVPLKYKNIVVGYICRSIDEHSNNKSKYFVKKPKNYLFNIEKIFEKNRKYIILVEGVFDAIPLDCTAILGNNLNKDQINLLNISNKEIIVCPDRDKGGENLIDIALQNNWKVFLPPKPNLPVKYREEKNKITCFWDDNIKDPGDACMKYGRIYTLKSIIDGSINDHLMINLYRNFILN